MSILQTQRHLHQIVAQASSLSERLLDPALVNSSEVSDPQIDQRLDGWCQSVAKGDRAKFLRRLAAEGLMLETLKPRLGEVAYQDGHPLPPWAEMLATVMQTAQEWRTPQLFDWQFLPNQAPHPFEPFYGPCLQVANHYLSSQLESPQWQRLSHSAQTALQMSLLNRLQTICAWTLFQEFSQFRSTGNSLQDFLFLQLQGHKRQDKYHAFLQQLFQDGFQQLFVAYPVLGRLIATAIEVWVEATTELLQRLSADWADLEHQFSQQPLTQVVELQPDLSDPHNRGRSTLILTFDTGLKLVYKPKDLGADVAYFQLLNWCNQQNLLLPFKCLQVLNRGSHGWVEYINALPCEDEAAARRFYRRSGMLLCLIHTLEGTDCHYENIIAHGEQPILIDTETLLTPRDAESRSSFSSNSPLSAAQLAHRQLDESVLRTLLLPQKGFSPNDLLELDISAFGALQEQQQTVLQVKNINLDTMQVEFVTVSIQQTAHAPTLNGKPLSPDNYLEEFVAGFEQMYHFLLNHQAELLSSSSPLKAFADQTVRFLFRATNTYSKILQQSYNPQLLRSGVDRSLALEVLGRAVCLGTSLPKCWSLFLAECQAMEDMDIPFFTGNSSKSSLTLRNGSIVPDLFAVTSFDQVMARVRQLSDADMTQQTYIIYGSFESCSFREPQLADTAQVRSTQSIAVEGETTLSQKSLLQQAIQIATKIRQQAIQAPDGSATWLGLFAKLNAEGFRFGQLKHDLCSGSCGIALFLAALAQTSNDSQWRDLAFRALQPLRQEFNSPQPDSISLLLRQHGIGGSMGVASLVYSLVQISDLLKEPMLRLEAQKMAALVTPELIALDRSYDISRGVAGTLLGLLALPEDDHALKMAIACGEHLLQHRTEHDTGFKGWKTWKGRSLTGFYQGSAGIAYALLRLFAVTQDERFRDTAIAAIAYEQSMFSIEANNWLDLRTDHPTFQTSWAQGAPGIGLARLGGLSALDTPEIRQDIAVALDTTQNLALWGIDSLCWGTLGRLETLLVAARQGDRPDLQQIAEQLAGKIVREAGDRGSFQLLPNRRSDCRLPGFLHGNAGIGYQLLRLVNDRLPSVLLWEVPPM